MTLFYIFLQISLMSGLIEAISAFAFDLSHYVVLFEVYEENLASHRFVVGNIRTSQIP